MGNYSCFTSGGNTITPYKSHFHNYSNFDSVIRMKEDNENVTPGIASGGRLETNWYYTYLSKTGKTNKL